MIILFLFPSMKRNSNFKEIKLISFNALFLSNTFIYRDVEMDGEWEAPLIPNPLCESAPGCGPWATPMIDNPAYRGKWRPPLVDNPNYKGKWRPRRIPNPEFFEDTEPFRMTSIVSKVFKN
jgi:hypothetical protein